MNGGTHPLGIIDSERLSLIPKKNHAEHELCFWLHDRMVELLHEIELQNANEITLDIDETELEELQNSSDPFDFLEKTNRKELSKNLTINQFSIAIFADICDHIHTSLTCLEKRKFTVAISLLRKPLKEGLQLVAHSVTQRDEFFELLKNNVSELYFSKLTPEDRIRIFDEAIKIVSPEPIINGQQLQELLFNRKSEFGLAGLFDQAAHYITNFSTIKTDNWNINFIFKDRNQNDIYENIYPELSKVLLLLCLLQLNLYSFMKTPRNGYSQWLQFVSIASHGALFLKGKCSPVNFVNNEMGSLMTCASCQSNMRLYKKDAAKFFISERITCLDCGFDQSFPFGWLFSKINQDNDDT